MISHKAVLNTLQWLQQEFPIGPEDVIGQKTASSFTDSVWEIFWPLIAGSRLVVIDDEAVKDANLLYKSLKDERVSVTQFVPPLMSAFTETVGSNGHDRDPLPHLKWVFNGGEALPVSVARDWYSVFRRAKIANIYGMTESAIYATNYIIQEQPDADAANIPAGKPIANARVYILDEHTQLRPLGSSGEICIGGTGIARGYLNQPELTDERFVPDPFSEDGGGRLYRTGDLGRYMPDGTIEYVGRRDNQVKIRSMRVELGEVEAALGQHPNVRQTAVVAPEDAQGDRRLVAYAVGEESPPPSIEELRGFLEDKLPEYMVPSAFMVLESLPLTPNGKVDRKRLPEPEPARVEVAGDFGEPTTPMEIHVAGIWQELLGLNVGKYDNFFDMGGHSLLSMKALARLKKTTGVTIEPREIMFQTLEQVAATCDERGGKFKDGESEGLTRRLLAAVMGPFTRRSSNMA